MDRERRHRLRPGRGQAAIQCALPSLDEREVLRLRFVEDLSQSQIATRIGHSQMHVSRILRGALEGVRAEVA
jgi:RNA polymerase sigma factor (sigma-70 family)